jgi:hypothetical protein
MAGCFNILAENATLLLTYKTRHQFRAQGGGAEISEGRKLIILSKSQKIFLNLSQENKR